MEEYGLDELAASAEAVMAGLGPLAVQLAGLALAAVRAVTLDAMETRVASLFPRDAVLNLAPLGYSWGLQRLAVMFCRSVRVV